MSFISVCGTLVCIVGMFALIASSSSTLKGNREYTYKAGMKISVFGILMIILGVLSCR